jgi:hypothetical protein
MKSRLAAVALALVAVASTALAVPAAAPAKPAAPAPTYTPPPPPAPAPVAVAGDRPQFGLGIAIVPFGSTLGASSPVELYVPIQLNRDFRLEPSLGLRVDNGPSGGTDHRDITVGVGAFLVRRVSPAVDLQLGGRLKLNLAKVSTTSNSKSGTDLFLGGAVGGEFYLAPHFSLGLEGDLGFFSNSEVSGDDSGLLTTGLAFLRVYF